MRGSLYDQTDTDFYKLDVTEQGVINIDFHSHGYMPNYDDHFELMLHTSETLGWSGPLATEYGGGNGEHTYLDFAVADPSLDYYLIVQTRWGDYTYEPDPYIISTTFTQGVDGYETEVNNTAAEADAVISGDSTTGVINAEYDDDWYVFDASAPCLLSVDLSSIANGDYFNVTSYP